MHKKILSVLAAVAFSSVLFLTACGNGSGNAGNASVEDGS